MFLYSKFGYDVKLLDKTHGSEIFRMLKDYFLGDGNTHEKSHDRSILKKRIVYAIEDKWHNPIGIFKDDDLIGISLSSVNDEEATPWLGYFYIKEKFRKTKAPVVLINYVANYLYQGRRIELQEDDDIMFKSLVRRLPLEIGYSILKQDKLDTIRKICEGSKQ